MAGGASGKSQTGMLRYPTVSKSHIAFVYAEDLWIVPKAGGRAEKLTSVPGRVSSPRFSPDGKWIGFTANYAGTWDLWIVSAKGGEPRRLTYHPDEDRMVGWLPDGSILFASSREVPFWGVRQLFSLPLQDEQDGRPPTPAGSAKPLPIGYAAHGSVWANQGIRSWRLAFQTVNRSITSFKGYRGGLAPEIYLVDLKLTKKGKIKRADPKAPLSNLTQARANDAFPMWHPRGERLFFLSDRLEPEADGRMLGGKRYNLWMLAVDASSKGKQARRLTPEGSDLREPDVGPCDLVWAQGGEIYRLDLDQVDQGTPEIQKVSIQVQNLRSAEVPLVRGVGDQLEWWDLSPDGEQVACAARGQVFVYGGERGPVYQVTREPGIANRYPSFSPDGKRVAYWSDALRSSSGNNEREYHLVWRQSDGSGDEEVLELCEGKFRYSVFWSPCGDKLAYLDSGRSLRLLELAAQGGSSREIDELGRELQPELIRLAFSPCGRWLAYAKAEPSGLRAIWCFDLEASQLHRLTGGYVDDWSPVFDARGTALYFLTKRSIASLEGDLGQDPTFANNTSIVRLGLSPGWTETNCGRGDQADLCKPELQARLEASLVEVSKAGNLWNLRAGNNRLLYLQTPRTGSEGGENELKLLDVTTEQVATIHRGAESFCCSRDGSTVLVSNGTSLEVLQISSTELKVVRQFVLGWEKLRALVSPREDHEQIFYEVWRLVRDYFRNVEFDEKEWEELRGYFEKMLEKVSVRWDLDSILNELLGELGSSHTYFSSPDGSAERAAGFGSLGADLDLEKGAVVIREIFAAGSIRSPLCEVNVSVGDRIVAINGRPSSELACPWQSMDGLAGEKVALTIEGRPDVVEVSCLNFRQHRLLRYRAWVEERRALVAAMGLECGHRLGYAHVPDVKENGFKELFRQVRWQVDREGMVIDLRFNSGGNLWPDRFLRLVDREQNGSIDLPGALPLPLDVLSGVGARAVLVNGWTTSYGELLAYLFKARSLGRVVGGTTAGIGTGSSGVPRLIGGNSLTVANLPFRDLQGEVVVERTGVEPDVPVSATSSNYLPEDDPELHRAVEVLVRELEQRRPRGAATRQRS